MRGIKQSLDLAIRMVDREYRASLKSRDEKLLAERLDAERVRDILRQYRELEKRQKELLSELKRRGVEVDFDGPQLSHKLRMSLAAQFDELLKGFKEQRDRILIRLPIADDQERDFMIRFFFDEIVKHFPALKTTMGKLQPNKGNPKTR
jgi:hypothetical protein